MKKQTVKNLINGVLAILCVALFLFLFIMLAFSYDGGLLTVIALVFLGVIITIFANSVVHELGHLIFGIFCGLKFYSIQFLWLFIGKENGKIKVKFSSSNGELGVTVLTPSSSGKTFQKYVISALGGLIFSLLIIISQVLICLYCKNVIVYASLGITFPISVYVFLINLFPTFENNDGYLIYSFLSGEKLKLVASNYYDLVGLLYEGVEPSELDSSKLIDYGGEDVYSTNLRYLRYLAYVNGDEESAIKELRKISDLSKLSNLVEEVYEELFFCALLIKDDKFITAHEEEVLEIILRELRPQSFRVHASYRIYKGDISWAKLIMQSGIEFSKSYAVKGVAKAEIKYLESMLNNLN